MSDHQHGSPGLSSPTSLAGGRCESADRARRTPIRTYWVPRWVLDRSWQFLREDGLKGLESTVLWGGRRFGEEAVVMAVLYPCGHDVALEPGFVHVGSNTTAEMGRWLRGQGLAALIQVHTHPGAWTGHSPTDDDFPIASSNGFVSLVWPHYGARPVERIDDLGIHRLSEGKWDNVEGSDAKALIRIAESEAKVWAPHPAPGPTREKIPEGAGRPRLSLLGDPE